MTRVRTATVLNPPSRLRTKRTNNYFVNIIVPWVRSKSLWSVSLEMLLFLIVSGSFLLYLESPTESIVEEGLRSVAKKCKVYQEATGGGNAIEEALRLLNVTVDEVEALETLGGKVDFCSTLLMFDRVESTSGWNWFNRWGYMSAVMFMATTVSTIGYGNLAPVTDAGRLLTMVASVMGIPLAGYFFFVVAEELRAWMLWWSHLTIKRWRALKSRWAASGAGAGASASPERGGGGGARVVRRASTASSVIAEVSDFRLLAITSALAFVFMLLASVFVCFSMGWWYEDSLWFIFVTTTTIGLGDIVPSWRDEMIIPNNSFFNYAMPLVATMFTVVGLSFTMAVVQSAGGVFEKEVVAKLDSQIGLGTLEEGDEEDSGDEWVGRRDVRGSSVFHFKNPMKRVEEEGGGEAGGRL
ncbi:hypothetical protein TrCOL_g9265 [Triparma columacea]|uniref:Potassium channel domain-containing protein n=1 Tax=Triparma columacea TaxID=722753 RepID=A0A9W7FVU5_9STRA|nr:hypothetical protein TrCOL_g9265 [Triparma columacea]